MHTILGSTGIIGTESARLLKDKAEKIRLVSRNPRQVNGDEELMKADLNNYDEVRAAVKGSKIVYLAAGLKYNHKVWSREWPVIMDNVIKACKETSAKLVFFDNIYALGRVEGRMTEESPLKPESIKGGIRAALEEKLIGEYEKNELEAMIVRAPDFYGPDCTTSMFNIMVVDKLKAGKNPMWFVNDKVKHSYIFTRDAAKGMVTAALDSSAYNQIWHLPTAEAKTGEEYIETACSFFNRPKKYTVVKKWQLKLLGLFVEPVRENDELLYQNEFDYIFDSSKFNKHFGYTPVSFKEGLKITAGI